MIAYAFLLTFLSGNTFNHSPSETSSSHLKSKTKIGLVTLKGTLSDAAPYINALRELFQDNSIKGIVLSIDSGGETALPSPLS